MDLNGIISTLRTELIVGEYICCDEEWGQSGKKIHNDPFSRLYLIKKGKGKIIHGKETIILEPGKLIVIPAFTPALYSCEPGMELLWIHFRAELFGSQEIFKFMNWKYTVNIRNRKEVTDNFQNLIRLLPCRDFRGFFSADTILRQLLCYFASNTDNVKGFQDVQRFLPAIVFIDQNLHRKINLKDLIKIVPLQSAYFCSLFSKSIGESPMSFINRKKIERAQFLLEDKSLKLKEVACMVGFSDVYYFSRIFKKVVGLAPDYYRKQDKI